MTAGDDELNRWRSLSSDIKIAVDREVHLLLSRHQQKHPEANIGSFMISLHSSHAGMISLG
jgi:hypothetical protein